MATVPAADGPAPAGCGEWGAQARQAQEWRVWTVTARLVVTDPDVLPAARAAVDRLLADVERAASRFRPDSEVSRIAARTLDGTVLVSATLADLLAVALEAGRVTEGAVDPTLGPEAAGDVVVRRTGPVQVRRRLADRDIDLDGRLLHVPAGTLFDLGATAKARAADLGAELVARRFGCGALVALGGDLRVSGPAPEGGWSVLVQDGPGEPADTVTLTGETGLATSSTRHRGWAGADPLAPGRLHHVLDPATGRPCPPVWRSVSVAAGTCTAANTWSTAAVVWGEAAPGRLAPTRLPARFVAADGRVTTSAGWPA